MTIAITCQAPVVQKVDSAIQRIKLYPVDSAIGFPNTCPLDSDLYVDSAIQLLNNWGQESYFNKNSLEDWLRLTRHGQASRHVSDAFHGPGGVIIVKPAIMYSLSIWLYFSN